MNHRFSFDVPGDPAAALAKAQAAVKEGGGTFSGDATGGTFSGPTPVGDVKGTYQVAGGHVTIEITEKPFLAPKALVESKIRGFFGA